MILLAIVTNLPEIAITASGAYRQDLGIAVGNILGGIGMQTLVLVLLDAIGQNGKASPSRRPAPPAIILEGVLVMAVLAVAIMGAQLPKSLIFARVTPAGALIVSLWVAGLWAVGATATAASPRGVKDGQPRPAPATEDGVRKPIMVFAFGAAVTLVCGVVLETSGEAIARRMGLSGVLFGATALAAATALPEISTGLAAVKLGDYQMAVSDVLGGNAFLPVLFPMATLMSGQAVLPEAQRTDIYLGSLGILLTAVYLAGLILRPARRIARMGIDSFMVLVLYLAGMACLLAMPGG
jgi:cation:H+ antiporter